MNHSRSQTIPVLKIVAAWVLGSTIIGFSAAQIQHEHGSILLLAVSWWLGAIGLLVHLFVRSLFQKRHSQNNLDNSIKEP